VRDTGQRTLLVTGPGHGAPAIHANLWMEGTHALYDSALSRDAAGMAELVRRFSWPGGFPSHLSPEVPGVINEGGELGYALSTAFGAAVGNRDSDGLISPAGADIPVYVVQPREDLQICRDTMQALT
jgi:xylulose-5-phosphate/fructose-6-phosphate phosphoketolase